MIHGGPRYSLSLTDIQYSQSLYVFDLVYKIYLEPSLKHVFGTRPLIRTIKNPSILNHGCQGYAFIICTILLRTQQ